jgi:hypothetical protein
VAEEQSTPQPDQEAATGGTDGNGSAEGESDALQAAKRAKEEEEEAKKKVKELEDDPPEKLEDWPDDKAKYETFGGPEGDEDYEESVTSKLGPSGVRFRDDGSVEVEGEKVENPDEFKSEPIPGGPTDPRASETRAYGEPDLTDETSVDVEETERGDDEGESEPGGGESGQQEEEDTSEGTSEGTSDDEDDEDGGEGDGGGEEQPA